MLHTLDETTLPATIFCCERAVERIPDPLREVVTRGHEARTPAIRGRPFRYPCRISGATIVRSASLKTLK
ncbi:hypothetical protein J8J14_23100 [Roseomonas sp. SSH11]|uniref:Uncharacterized protein n=1 Tax=Pararoseomonas baculiformis TaxID=2820812 RepID=A0ABS4AKV4_9PROT|nr:hypothetical protein [Pararoseomonas baculiformis]MBP0447650.1 hypothetical protein [Pararoseomonas baculiformis]